MGTNLLNEIQINTLSSTVKFINNSSKIVTINLYNNKRLFPDFDGGDYIAVNTSSGVGYMYCSSTLYTVGGKTTSNLAFTFKGRDGNIRYVYTKQPNNITESLVTTLTTEVTNYSAIKQEDFPCGGAIYVVSCRGQNGYSGSNGGKYNGGYDGYGGSGGSGGAGGNGWNVKFTPSSFWNITGRKTSSIAPYSTNFDLCTHETYGGGGGGGGGGIGSVAYSAGSGGAGGSASPMPPGARVIFPSKTDVVITATKRPGGAGDSGGKGENYDSPSGNNGGYGGSVSGNGKSFFGEAGRNGNKYQGGNGGAGATYNYAWDIERISYAYSYDQVKGVLSIDPYSNGFSNSVTSTSGIVITKFNAFYGE